MTENNRRYEDGLRDGKDLARQEGLAEFKQSTEKALDRVRSEVKSLRIAMVGNGEKENCVMNRLAVLEAKALFNRKLIFSLLGLITGLAITTIFR